MPDAERLQVNAPTVAWEAVEGEVIVINLGTGTYYSLDAAGALLWEGLAAGATVADCVAAVRARYEGEEPLIRGALDELIRDLQTEGLVVPASPDDSPDDPRDPGTVPGIDSPGPADDGERTPFVAPRLERYIDLQNLIQLDPVLAVDERGWPLAERP
ncbi:MAG: PqqD family protein [Acidimicrobiia bacterium]